MFLPCISGRAATLRAASTLAPVEMPAHTPCRRIRRRAVAMASAVGTWMISSSRLRSRMEGTKLAPMPWMPCCPACPPERTGDSAGSTAMTLKPGMFSLRKRPVPVMDEPEPTPATSTSIWPTLSARISGPVVR